MFIRRGDDAGLPAHSLRTSTRSRTTLSGSRPSPHEGMPSTYCAVIMKTVDARTRSKTSINELLRD